MSKKTYTAHYVWVKQSPSKRISELEFELEETPRWRFIKRWGIKHQIKTWKHIKSKDELENKDNE